MRKAESFAEELKRQCACNAAVDWAEKFDDPNKAWKACERSDWMVWLLYDFLVRKGLREREKKDFYDALDVLEYWSPDEIRQLIPNYPL